MQPIVSKLAFPFTLALCTSSAWAACPVAADLRTGIYVSYDDGSYTKFMQSDVDEVTETVFNSSGDADVFTTRYGVFEISYAWSAAGKIDPSTLETIRYLKDIPARDALVPGFAFGSAIVTDFADPAIASKRVAYAMGVKRTDPRMIGGCSYEALAIDHTYVHPDGMTRLSTYYIPELSISIVEGITEPGFGWSDFPAAVTISNIAQ